jgi:hypothetical protein
MGRSSQDLPRQRLFDLNQDWAGAATYARNTEGQSRNAIFRLRLFRFSVRAPKKSPARSQVRRFAGFHFALVGWNLSRKFIALPDVSSKIRISSNRGRAYSSGLGLFGRGARLISVSQFRHENVSNSAPFSSDLLVSIASPQSGQCRIGGRGGADIGTAF